MSLSTSVKTTEIFKTNTLNIDKLRADNENDLVYQFYACTQITRYFDNTKLLRNWYYKGHIKFTQTNDKFFVPYELWKKYMDMGYRQTDFYNLIKDILLREFNIMGLEIDRSYLEEELPPILRNSTYGYGL